MALRFEGVDFKIGQADECFDLLKQKRGFNDSLEHRQLAEKIRLFKVEMPRYTVSVLESNVLRSKNILPDFFWLSKSDVQSAT